MNKGKNNLRSLKRLVFDDTQQGNHTVCCISGKADPPVPYRLYFHNEAPICGNQLSKQLCSFEKLKLTNNALDQNGHVSAQNFQRMESKFIGTCFFLLKSCHSDAV